jgi:DNA polymerase
MERLAQKIELLLSLEKEVHCCTGCRLHETRTFTVFGMGNVDADLVFVGEGPGADEDAAGEPFVGAAGKILTRMIYALGLTRRDIYICNIIKCRPPGNRNPQPDEIDSCKRYLLTQLDVVQPKVICTLGAVPTHFLLNAKATISRLRGRVFSFRGVKVVPTFHPAYIYRSPSKKLEVWKDLKLVEKLLNEKESIVERDTGSAKLF